MNKITWAIVLAAGKSTRMQKQKLLLPFGEETIIRKVVNTAIHAADGNVLVVLGSHSQEIREQINNGG
ncbi:MAG: NTP transferase domain-containing protein, partial [Mariniphaga sp.]